MRAIAKARALLRLGLARGCDLPVRAGAGLCVRVRASCTHVSAAAAVPKIEPNIEDAPASPVRNEHSSSGDDYVMIH